MKIGVISDTHGSLDNTKKALDILKDCDTIFHLGDVLYHGPRNALPEDYNPKDLAVIFKSMDNVIYTRGNCDSDVDQMVIEHDLTQKHRIINIGKFRIFTIHGYEEDEEKRIRIAKANNCDIVITGHTHVKVLEDKEGVILLNPGSPSIPKDGVKSVAIIDDDEIKLIDTDSNKVLSSLKILGQLTQNWVDWLFS